MIHLIIFVYLTVIRCNIKHIALSIFRYNVQIKS